MRAYIVMRVLAAVCVADTGPAAEWQAQRPQFVPDLILHTSHDASTLCQRRSLNVNLKDIKWKVNVVAPIEYDAGYCESECPSSMLARLNSTQHTLVQSLASKTYVMPKPCCVPIEFSSVIVLYSYLDE